MGPPASNRVSRVRSYSGVTSLASAFVYGDFTLFVSTFQLYSTSFHSIVSDPQPHIQVCGLASFPFARRYLGNRCFFLFLRVLRCFSSPGSPRYTIYSCNGDGPLRPPGFPIRISMDQCLLTAPHGFSQLTASFFGS